MSLPPMHRPLAALRIVQDRSATRTVATPVGRALLNDSVPRSYAHNFMRVETAAPAVAIVAAADEALGHLAHRHLSVFDAATAEGLAGELPAFGYTGSCAVVMVHGGTRPAGEPAARLADWVEVRPVLLEFWRAILDDEETVRQLVDRGLVTAQACRLRYVVAEADGRPAASADLRQGVVDGVAQIEEVGTLQRARGRGLATSILQRALQLADDDGASTIFLLADRDDWPRAFYERLGFATVGEIWEFTRSPG